VVALSLVPDSVSDCSVVVGDGVGVRRVVVDDRVDVCCVEGDWVWVDWK
jgi:hypothetical protein